MQIVIDIPDKYISIYTSVKDWIDKAGNDCKVKPLPKGHGRLGDLDKIKKEMRNYHDDCAKTSKYTRLGFETAMTIVDEALTIIEADSEEDSLDNLDSMLEDLWNNTVDEE